MHTLAQRLPEDDLIERVLRNYGIARATDDERMRFVAKHIELLETSDNEAVARSGFVLRRAQEGFGLGYKVPMAVISMGQAMLGLDLAVAAPFIASNPAALTCAALGAIYYGYSALSDEERQTLHAAIGAAIQVGVELVRCIVEFCITTLKSILDKQTLVAVRDFVAEYSRLVGSSLGEVTGKLSDRAVELGRQAASGAEGIASSVWHSASSILAQGAEKLGRATGKDEQA